MVPKQPKKQVKTLFDQPANPIKRVLFVGIPAFVIIIMFIIVLLNQPGTATFPPTELESRETFTVPYELYESCSGEVVTACQQYAIFTLKEQAYSLPISAYGALTEEFAAASRKSLGRKLQKQSSLLQVEASFDEETQQYTDIFSPNIYVLDLENNVIKRVESKNFVMREPDRSREICKFEYTGEECLYKTGISYAASTNDPTLCKQYDENPTLLMSCDKNLAVALDSTDFCRGDSTCITAVARNTEDPIKCNQVENLFSKYRCRQEVRLVEGLETLNISLCLNMSDESQVTCASAVAIANNDDSFCEVINDIDGCKENLAIETQDSALCKQISTTTSCLQGIAFTTKDASFCDVTDNECYTALAISNKDTNLCKNDDCKEQVATAKKYDLSCLPDDAVCLGFIEQEAMS